MTDYEAGKCNIDGHEQRRRYFLGSAGFTTAGIYVLANRLGSLPVSSDLLLFALFFIGFNGFIQGRLKFCAGYGILSRQNTSDREDTEKVPRSRKDLLESLRIQLYSLFSAVVVTALVNAFVL
jgi:hypothetical protein